MRRLCVGNAWAMRGHASARNCSLEPCVAVHRRVAVYRRDSSRSSRATQRAKGSRASLHARRRVTQQGTRDHAPTQPTQPPHTAARRCAEKEASRVVRALEHRYPPNGAALRVTLVTLAPSPSPPIPPLLAPPALACVLCLPLKRTRPSSPPLPPKRPSVSTYLFTRSCRPPTRTLPAASSPTRRQLASSQRSLPYRSRSPPSQESLQTLRRDGL